MGIMERLTRGETKLAVVGLGYVGLPIAAAFSKRVKVIGYDRDAGKIAALRAGRDLVESLGEAAWERENVAFTTDPADLGAAQFIIVAVPTPIHEDKTPDLTPVVEATRAIGRHLQKGSIVVYESTVYPGVTEEICLPILEQESGLASGADFFVGYSPERINPGDKVHTLENIVKIVSGMDERTLDEVASVYASVVDTVYRAPAIRVAEAAKLVENTQRDVNIAFLNELSMVFHRMGIDTNEVVRAMNTKWNALRFRPGLVGGHCIGVDPYYLVYQAERYGIHPRIVSGSRAVNDGIGEFIATETLKALVRAKADTAEARICILGVTFKEDCPDVRNSRSVDVYRALKAMGLSVFAVDPVADAGAFAREYHVPLTPLEEIGDMDAVLVLVGHAEFVRMAPGDLAALYRKEARGKRVLMDAKSVFDRSAMEAAGYVYWNL